MNDERDKVLQKVETLVDERDKVLQKVKDIEALVDDYTKRCEEFHSKNTWSNISLVIIGIICGIFIGYLIQ